MELPEAVLYELADSVKKSIFAALSDEIFNRAAVRIAG
jgi:hypothetical protein